MESISEVKERKTSKMHGDDPLKQKGSGQVFHVDSFIIMLSYDRSDEDGSDRSYRV